MEKISSVQALIEERKRQYERQFAQTAKIVQSCYETEAGKYFIQWLATEARFFAGGLQVISNLKEKYKVPPEYYTGQTDLIKKIMKFLTADQVADLTVAVVKKQETKKEKEEEENGRE